MINSLGMENKTISVLIMYPIDNLCDLNYRKKTVKLCLFFRNQCEELRSTLSKRQQDEVCVERLEQLRLKEEIEREKKEHEAMYAKLWEQDM